MEFIFGYIDPGSGSLVIQALIAGIIAVPIFFRSKISKFVRAIRGNEEPSVETTPEPDESEPSN
jgi:hypothetical protein